MMQGGGGGREALLPVALFAVVVALFAVVAVKFLIREARRKRALPEVEYLWASSLPAATVVDRLSQVREHMRNPDHARSYTRVEPMSRPKLAWYDNRRVDWTCHVYLLKDGSYHILLVQQERVFNHPTVNGNVRDDGRGGCRVSVKSKPILVQESLDIISRATESPCAVRA